MTGWRSPILIAVLVFGVLFLLMYFSSANVERSAATRMVATVIIPEGSSLATSERNNFEPAIIKVVIGVNNTVRWINEDSTSSSVVADDNSDPDFYNATYADGSDRAKSFLNPGETFEFTFAKPGEFGYHSEPHPHKHGTVVVLASEV